MFNFKVDRLSLFNPGSINCPKGKLNDIAFDNWKN